MKQAELYPDSHLLEKLACEDRQAFQTLYHKYWPLLYNSAYKLLKDKEVCQEIVHDVLLDLWLRRHALAVDNLEAYLKKAVRYRAINFVTRQRPPAFFELLDTIAISPNKAEDALLEKDLLELIKAWVEVLPRKRRQIFVRHFFEHLSTREIAGEMNLSQKTVQNQLVTALQYLRSHLGFLRSLLLSLATLLGLVILC